MKIENYTKDAVRYLEENQACKNEHGMYIFISQNGHEILSLDLYLLDYKNWLIENKIVKLI